jgi:hypothetical protein
VRRALPLLLLVGCTPGSGPDPASTPAPTPVPTVIPDTFDVGDAIACADPVDGPDRFVDEGALRGLDWDQDNHPEPDPVGDGVVAIDVDDDGDIDLLMGGFPGFPRVLLNDGGFFAEAGHPEPELPAPKRMRWSFWGAADLDGDRLPELLGYDNGWAAYARNLGGGAFG